MKTYKSTGLVLGNMWGGGTGSYPARMIKAKTRKELIETATKMLKDGSLDSGMGFESLKGALIDIEEIETIEIDGKNYTRTEYDTESIGDLSDADIEFLFEILDNN